MFLAWRTGSKVMLLPYTVNLVWGGGGKELVKLGIHWFELAGSVDLEQRLPQPSSAYGW